MHRIFVNAIQYSVFYCVTDDRIHPSEEADGPRDFRVHRLRSTHHHGGLASRIQDGTPNLASEDRSGLLPLAQRSRLYQLLLQLQGTIRNSLATSHGRT